MKYIFLFFLTLSTTAWAKSPCISPKEAQMPNSADLQIPKSNYSVGICYLTEKVKKGVSDGYYKDLIVLKKAGTSIADSETKMSITVGRISDLVFEKATDRFIAVTYGAGEFCNGVVIFDTRLKKAAMQKGCSNNSDMCAVIELNDSKCSAKIECRDGGAEGDPAQRKEPIIQTINLCK